MEKRQIYISWHTFGQMAEKLIRKVAAGERRFNGVFGIPRGGIALAMRASHRLHLPMLLHPDVDSIIFDDISDNGDTLRRHIPRYTQDDPRHGRPGIACLFTTPWTTVTPDWYLDSKKDKKQWIVYPWEVSITQAKKERMIFYRLGKLKDY